jgi:hypothetical protein
VIRRPTGVVMDAPPEVAIRDIAIRPRV